MATPLTEFETTLGSRTVSQEAGHSVGYGCGDTPVEELKFKASLQHNKIREVWKRDLPRESVSAHQSVKQLFYSP